MTELIDSLEKAQNKLEVEIDSIRKNLLAPLSAELTATHKKLAKLYSPVKIGEKITERNPMSAEPDTFIVTNIEAKRYGNKYVLYGHKIKKDGTPGAIERELYFYTEERWRVTT